MTNQEAFNIVVTGLRQQGRKSLFTAEQRERFKDIIGQIEEPCAYRGEGDTKCAFGFLIPDDLYDPSMENVMASVVLDRFPAVQEHLEGVNHDLISKLQHIHDKRKPEHWEESLTVVANDFNLTMP